MTPEARFARLSTLLLKNPGVIDGSREPAGKRGFGSNGLKAGKSIFAMLVRGRLVVKLPRERVDELVAAGIGKRFDPRRDGRAMKEWLVIDPAAEARWTALAKQALAFVGGRSG